MMIHIGFHKTASTLLQQKIFNNNNYGFKNISSREEIFEDFILTNPFTFNPVDLNTKYSARIDKIQGLVPVLTEEALSGNIYQGKYCDKAVADRLKSTFPNAKILIVIREQIDMLLSLYKWMLSNQSSLTLEEFLYQPASSTGFEPNFRLEYLEYHHLIQYYQTLFGKENVLVNTYEQLKESPTEFFKRINEFAGTNINLEVEFPKVNKAITTELLLVKRYINKMTPQRKVDNKGTINEFVDKFFHKINSLALFQTNRKNKYNQKLEIKLKDIIGGQYKESNNILSKLIKTELRKYRYDLPS